MKLFSISMVKNEIDIIETFIRYHSSMLDRMVILDNGSTDGTTEVINKLMAEGLPITLIFDDSPSYDQSSMTTGMLYSALDQFDPDIVIPLDVDEFLISENSQPIRDALETQLHQNSLFFLSWITFVPTKGDPADELNPLKRITYRRVAQNNYDRKVIIPKSIARQHQIVIKQGNHDIVGEGTEKLERQGLSKLNLAHFPIRSESQAKSKYLVGWLANLARDKQVLFDWYYYYNIIKGGGHLTPDDLTKLALFYDVPNKRLSMDMVREPIHLSGKQDFSLRYTSKDDGQYFTNVLNYSETLARKYSELKKQPSAGSHPNHWYSDQMILQIIKEYAVIDGWLSPREAVALYRLVKSVPRKEKTICEIGSWLGKSSYVLVRALDNDHNGRLICVDPFDASGDNKSAQLYQDTASKLGKSILETFTSTMQRLGVYSRIKVISGHSHEVIRNFNQPIDVLFIDGDHGYESVKRDFQDWSPLIKIGGYIAFHDVGASHATGPKEVVELEVVRNPNWGEQLLIDELYIAKKIG